MHEEQEYEWRESNEITASLMWKIEVSFQLWQNRARAACADLL